jgi:predicted membrane channel-forming protein YqfA (hemolysin III family)
MKEVIIDYSRLPQVHLWGLTLLEPVTVVTNLMIAATCLYAFFTLCRMPGRHRAQHLAAYFFLFMALANMVGGVLGHGLLYLTGMWGRLPGWFLSMAAVALFERAAIWHASPLLSPRIASLFSWLNYIEIALLATLAFITLNFFWVEVHAFYGLFVVVFSLEYFVYLKTGDPATRNIFMGTALAGVASIVHMFKLGIHAWFNHNDISHLIMAVGVWYYYRGIVALRLTLPATQIAV